MQSAETRNSLKINRKLGLNQIALQAEPEPQNQCRAKNHMLTKISFKQRSFYKRCVFYSLTFSFNKIRKSNKPRK